MLKIYRSPTSVYNYDEIPPGYYYRAMQQGGPVQRFWHKQKFRAVVQHLENGMRVLDVGCGPGSFLSILAAEHDQTRAIGVDIASGQIDFARQEVASKYPGRIEFRTMDATNPPRFPFEDGEFDAVTSIEVIEHIHPHLAYGILSEAKRVLKPEGRLVLTTPNYRSIWPFLELLLERLSEVKYHEQHINCFTPNSFVKFVETAGFDVTAIETIFAASPFLAALSEPLARKVMDFERWTKVRAGSLLLIEARKSRMFQ